MNPNRISRWHGTNTIKAAVFVTAALILVFGLSGCASYTPPTDRERAETFKPFVHAMMGGQPAQDFISERTALLLDGDLVESAGENHASAVS